MAEKGVIILAHGSRNTQSVDKVLSEITRGVKARLLPEAEVVWAAMQFNHPNLGEAVDTLVKQGVKQVVIMPYFLFEGIHFLKDIPCQIEVIKQNYPQIKFILTSTLGLDESLVDLVVKRIRGAELRI